MVHLSPFGFSCPFACFVSLPCSVDLVGFALILAANGEQPRQQRAGRHGQRPDSAPRREQPDRTITRQQQSPVGAAIEANTQMAFLRHDQRRRRRLGHLRQVVDMEVALLAMTPGRCLASAPNRRYKVSRPGGRSATKGPSSWVPPSWAFRGSLVDCTRVGQRRAAATGGLTHVTMLRKRYDSGKQDRPAADCGGVCEGITPDAEMRL